MKLTILGSGTAVPTKQRYSSAYLLQEGKATILVDCGPMTLTRLLEHDVDFQSIDAVAITHFHPDHVSHLLPLVQARFVDDIYEGREHKPLTVFAPQTMQERWQKLREVSWVEPQENPPLNFHEGPTQQRVGDIMVQSFPVVHVSWFPSVGYRFSVGDKSVAYTGDLGPQQEEAFNQGVAGADYLIIEAAAAQPGETHLTAEQAVELGKNVGAKHVMLTHLRETIIAQAQAVADQNPGFVSLAEDNMVIQI